VSAYLSDLALLVGRHEKQLTCKKPALKIPGL